MTSAPTAVEETLLATAPSPIAVVLIPVGAIAVVERSATRPPPDYGAAVFDTGFGSVQVDLVRQLVRGPALLAGLAAVQLLLAR